MENKDVTELEIKFSAVKQIGEQVQAFTEEQLKSLNIDIDPEKVEKALSKIDENIDITNRIREHIAKSLNASNYVTAVEMVGTHQHEAMVADAIRRGRQAKRYPLTVDDDVDDGFFKPLNPRQARPSLIHLGGDYEGDISIPVYQTESSAFHIYCYLLAKEQLRNGIPKKADLNSMVNLCKNFKRCLNKSKLLRFLYKSYTKELKTKTVEEVKNQYIGARNVFVDDIISKLIGIPVTTTYLFNGMVYKQAQVQPDLRLGDQFGHFANWEEVNNVKNGY